MKPPSEDRVQVPLAALMVGHWYVGRGRNGRFGLWTGDHFVVPGPGGLRTGPGPRDWTRILKFHLEPYYLDGGGCFLPLHPLVLPAGRWAPQGLLAELFGPWGAVTEVRESAVMY